MKNELRKTLKKLRDSIENKAFYDDKITEAFLTSSLYRDAETILLYSSCGSEVSTKEILDACLKDGKRIAFPICLDKDGIMDFFIVKSKEDLEEGMYGIMAPAGNCRRLISDKKCLCVVPGLAFDKEGYRIGYGKGYYDRYLDTFEGVSVGLSYDELVVDNIPADVFDKKVSYLITDKKIYKFNSKEDLKNG